jgi:environmental stress-induced protein Ves
MKHKVIHAADVIRKRWSGGISSQYYIYPEGADRSTGEYAFIVTSATVELEESTFSDYTGFDRVIMSLTEAYDLTHDDKESHHLQPLSSSAIELKKRIRMAYYCFLPLLPVSRNRRIRLFRIVCRMTTLS